MPPKGTKKQNPKAASVKGEGSTALVEASQATGTGTGGTGDTPAQKSNAKAVRLPRSVQDSLKEITDAGKELTVDNLVEHFASKTSKEMSKLYSGMSYTNGVNNPTAKKEYEDGKLSDAQKRAWLARFALKPEAGGAEGYNDYRAVKKDYEVEDEEKLTLQQIADQYCGGNKELAEVWARDLVEIPHESPSLAALGHKMYIKVKSKKRRLHGTEEAAGVHKKVAMSDAAFAHAAASIQGAMSSEVASSSGGGAPVGKTTTGKTSTGKSKVVPPPAGLNAEQLAEHEVKMEEIRKKEAIAAAKGDMSKKVGKLKSLIDIIKSDVKKGEVDIERSKMLSLPQHTQDYCKGVLSKHHEYLDPAEKAYLEILLKIPDLKTVADFEAVGSGTAGMVPDLQQKHDSFKKSALLYISNQNKADLTALKAA